MNCLFCQKETSNPKFCSKSCAAKYNNTRRKPRSIKSRNRTSMSLKGRKNTWSTNPELHPRWCAIRYHPCNFCGKIFTNPKRSTCSIVCRDNIRSKNGSLVRQYLYKNFIFQSSWEVKIAKFLDDNKVIWSQPKKRLHWEDSTLKRTRTYLPDFYLENFYYYLDVKNPIKQLKDADKIKQLKEQFPLFVGNIQEVQKFVARLAGLEPTCIH